MLLSHRAVTDIYALIKYAPTTRKLTSWEHGFLRNMKLRIDKYGVGHDTTPYQFQVLNEICAKVYKDGKRIVNNATSIS